VEQPEPAKCPELEYAAVTPASAVVGAIAGIVQDDRCVPLRGAELIAKSPAVAGDQVMFTDESGRFVLDELPPGTYAIAVRYWRVEQARTVVVVRAGESTNVAFRIHVPPRPDGEVY